MKKFTLLAVFFVVLSAIGCKSTKEVAPTYADDPRSKVVGAEGILRPEWMNGTKKSEDLYYVVGDGRMGMSKSAQQGTARTDGLAKVAQWKSSVVADTMKNYMEEGGTIGNTQVLMRFEQATITRSNTNLSGFDLVEYWIDADNVYHGLFSYPKSDLRKDFQTTVSEFQRNEAAAFAEFKAQEAFRQLESQLNK
ncbi:MAG: hypothetical protein LBB72_08770 [Spirochaetaceae bacterium]|jgi:hypothetical protein|nr:hypothetical protein [Spirochaetaceae bacterium]